MAPYSVIFQQYLFWNIYQKFLKTFKSGQKCRAARETWTFFSWPYGVIQHLGRGTVLPLTNRREKVVFNLNDFRYQTGTSKG